MPSSTPPTVQTVIVECASQPVHPPTSVDSLLRTEGWHHHSGGVYTPPASGDIPYGYYTWVEALTLRTMLPPRRVLSLEGEIESTISHLRVLQARLVLEK